MLVADMLARSLVFGAELPLSVLTILFLHQCYYFGCIVNEEVLNERVIKD